VGVSISSSYVHTVYILSTILYMPLGRQDPKPAAWPRLNRDYAPRRPPVGRETETGVHLSVYIYTYIPIYICTYCTYIYLYTYVHIYIYTYVHTVYIYFLPEYTIPINPKPAAWLRLNRDCAPRRPPVSKGMSLELLGEDKKRV